MRHDIRLTVNGFEWSMGVEPPEVLLDVLRERLGIKSPKIGCERGDCGSCTVLIDDATVRSCLVLAVEADGREVTTLEGLAGETLTALQDRLVAMSSFQCGFCAPGIVLAVHELMAANPLPGRSDVEEAISGNLCRCTGYDPIVDAVLAVVEADGGTR